MTEIIRSIDLEDALVAWLPDQLAAHSLPGRPVGTRIPNPRPAEFVRLMVSGGAREWPVKDVATVIVEGWGATETAASLLCRTAVAIIAAAPELTVPGAGICQVETNLPINLPDPDSAQTRYTATLSLTLRAAAI